MTADGQGADCDAELSVVLATPDAETIERGLAALSGADRPQ